MGIPTDKDSLTKLFEKLGAPYPELLARSQLEDGHNDLLRFLFLREAWKSIVSVDDSKWIDASIESSHRNPKLLTSRLGRALSRLRASGADDRDLAVVVREMQTHLLFRICYLIDGHDAPEPEVEDIQWGLFHIDDDGYALGGFGALHESVSEWDPAQYSSESE